jgi:hypothetical protein
MKTFIAILCLLCLSATATAQDISLSWDKNKDAKYYVVYWGLTTGEYTGESEKVYGLTYNSSGLPEEELFFSVKAFNICGNSSDFSDPASSCDVDTPPDKMAKPIITRRISIDIKIDIQD